MASTRRGTNLDSGTAAKPTPKECGAHAREARLFLVNVTLRDVDSLAKRSYSSQDARIHDIPCHTSAICQVPKNAPVLFREFDKTNTEVFAKDATKRFLRRFLGLDVRLARSRKYHLHTYTHNAKHVTRFMHFQHLLKALHDVEGHIVECGVGPGLSLFDFAMVSQAIGKGRHMYGFDSFEGLPDPTPSDGPWNVRSGGLFSYSVRHVQDELRLAGLKEEFIGAHITLIPGPFSATLPRYDKGPIALLHIDVDLYDSYRTVLENLYDYVVPHGIIAFDEYRQEPWPGATAAIDEFFSDKAEKPQRSELADRYYIVKQQRV